LLNIVPLLGWVLRLKLEGAQNEGAPSVLHWVCECCRFDVAFDWVGAMRASVVANAMGPTVAACFGGSYSFVSPVKDGGVGCEGVLEALVVRFPVAVGFEEVRHEIVQMALWLSAPLLVVLVDRLIDRLVAIAWWLCSVFRPIFADRSQVLSLKIDKVT
jgi:hypothetical protein